MNSRLWYSTFYLKSPLRHWVRSSNLILPELSASFPPRAAPPAGFHVAGNSNPSLPVAQPKTLKSFLNFSLSLSLSTSLTANPSIDLLGLLSEYILNFSTSHHLRCWNTNRHHHHLFLVTTTPCIWLLCFYRSWVIDHSQQRATVILLKHVKSR